MNAKLEEKLAQLAFGDLSPEEAARIEAQVRNDPEALHALNMYHGMRAELRGLKDIPQDQMSKERLRDAILAQGLKPKATSKFGWGWLWMPAMASVLAVGIMLVRGNDVVEQPNIVVSNESIPDMRVALKEPTPEKIDFSPSVSDPVVTTKSLVTTAAPVVQKARPRAPMMTTARPSEKRLAPVTEAEKVAIETAAWSELVASIDTPGGDTVREDETVAMTTPPIVIIEDSVDQSTGAMAATEVGASNVLIGG